MHPGNLVIFSFGRLTFAKRLSIYLPGEELSETDFPSRCVMLCYYLGAPLHHPIPKFLLPFQQPVVLEKVRRVIPFLN